jgi:hypothetical protein
MQRMNKEIEQQKQTDTPTVEEIIDENVQQNPENDIHGATTNESNHPELNKLIIQLKNENLTI